MLYLKLFLECLVHSDMQNIEITHAIKIYCLLQHILNNALDTGAINMNRTQSFAPKSSLVRERDT